MKKPFKPQKIQCKICNSIISSSYPGEFVSCKCPRESQIFVDQTEYYIRLGGNPEQMIHLKDDEDASLG